jgi:hypothetical protein
MTEHHDSTVGLVAKTIVSIVAWFGAVKLADVQVMVAILSGLIVAGYAGTQWFFLVRDRMKGKK